ncbi:ribosomal protein S10 [Meredithblackwellia eburnea MCA 4105]
MVSVVRRIAQQTKNLIRLSSTLASSTPATTPVPPPPSLSSSAQGSTSSSAVTAPKPTPAPAKQNRKQALTNPFSHHVPIPPTSNIHVATLHLRSHTTSLASLSFFTSFALRSARALGIPTSNIVYLPTRSSLYTVPRSPFAHKKSQENFQKKEHRRAVKVFDADEKVLDVWFGFLRREAMGGVGMKVQRFEYKEVGWGRSMGSLPENLAGGEGEVQGLANELVKELEKEVELGKKAEDEVKAIKKEKGERRELEEVQEGEK